MVETVMVTQDNCGILKVGFPFPDTSLSGFLLQAVSEFVIVIAFVIVQCSSYTLTSNPRQRVRGKCYIVLIVKVMILQKV